MTIATPTTTTAHVGDIPGTVVLTVHGDDGTAAQVMSWHAAMALLHTLTGAICEATDKMTDRRTNG